MMAARIRVLMLAAGLALVALPGSVSADQTNDYLLAFGDIHNHTRYSDGSAGTPADAFAAAERAGADFLATSDHNFMLTEREWAQTLLQAAAATSEDFAALAGSELWIASGYGEVIVLGVDDVRLKANFRSPRASLSRDEVIPAVLDWLVDSGGVGIWPHPGVYGDLDEFDHWTAERDAAMVGVEIHNYGSFLGAPANWGVHDYEDQYQLALAKGWHLMPLAVSDTHAPDWISGSPVRTVLLVESFEPDGVIEAFRQHRGYASLDANLEVDFRVGGAVMGSDIAAGGPLKARVEVQDPDGASDAVTLVELVGPGGAVLASHAPGSPSAYLLWEPEIPASAQFAYLRVTTVSGLSGGPGVTAWTAPVWLID
jgi:hypothetical protein